jgi:hypothetical protein
MLVENFGKTSSRLNGRNQRNSCDYIAKISYVGRSVSFVCVAWMALVSEETFPAKHRRTAKIQNFSTKE